MTIEIGIMFGVLVLALVLFARETFPIEVTALGLLALLLGIGFLDVEEALTGFSNKAVIAIGALFVLSHALVKTGVLEVVVDVLRRRGAARPWVAVGLLLAAVSVLSGFLNNTAVVAIFIPLALSLCRQIDVNPSKVLIPLSYASIFGGTLTLIGTSTNLLVSSVVESAGGTPFGMFEFLRLGIVFLGVGLVYLVFFAPRWLPERAATDLTEKYRMTEFLAELRVQDASELAGKTLAELELNQRHGATVVEILRGEKRMIENIRDLTLERGDLLIVQAPAEVLLSLREEQGLALLPDVVLSDETLSEGGMVVAEGLVAFNSRVVGKRVEEIDFRELYGGFVLAVRRVGGTIRDKISRTRLRFSDSVLMLVPNDRLDELRRSDDFVILSQLEIGLNRRPFWWLVLILLPAAVLAAALGIVDIAGSAFLAATVLLLFGVITPQEAYRSINWSVIFLIAAFVPVGIAFASTGTAGFIASRVLSVTALLPADLVPYAVVALLYLVTTLMTQMISNAAAAIILAPIALSLADTLGVDSRPLLMAVCFAASAEFMTPMGYQTNLMVYGPGAYRFLDYTRFGGPLNLLFWILAALLIPVIWPF